MRFGKRGQQNDQEVLTTWTTGYEGRSVVGESFHETELKSLARSAGKAATGEATVTAVLVPEPNNRYDRNAIAVKIDGKFVGHLPKEDAARYVTVLGPLAQQGKFLSVPARLWWDSQRGSFMASVTLDLPDPDLLFPVNQFPAGAAVLPSVWRVQISGEENHMDALAPVVAGRPEALVCVTLHEFTDQRPRSSKQLIEARLDGRRIGQMSPTTSEALLPVARHVEGLGLTLGAYAVARGNALQVEVTVLAQKANEVPQEWLDSLPASAGQHEEPAGSSAADEPARQATELPPPNWYPDPGDPTQLRYWDGSAWTEHVHRNS